MLRRAVSGRRELALTLAAAAMTLAAAGCGGKDEEEAVRDTVRDYLSAFASGDGDRACDLLAASGRRELVELANTQVPEVGTTDCAEIVKQLTSLADEEDLNRLEDVEVRNVRIEGDTATAEAVGATQRPELRKIDDEWKITSLGSEAAGSAAPPVDEPPPAEEPPAEEEPAADPVEEVADRLEQAGFDIADADIGSGEPTPEGALEVALDGGAQVTIYVYSSAADARRSRADFKPVEADQPDQIEVRAVDELLFVGTVEEPKRLSTSDFNDVVMAATT